MGGLSDTMHPDSIFTAGPWFRLSYLLIITKPATKPTVFFFLCRRDLFTINIYVDIDQAKGPVPIDNSDAHFCQRIFHRLPARGKTCVNTQLGITVTSLLQTNLVGIDRAATAASHRPLTALDQTNQYLIEQHVFQYR